MKKCRNCDIEKDFNSFYKSKKGKLISYCKTCHNRKSHEYRHSTPEKKEAYKLKRKKYDKTFRIKHPRHNRSIRYKYSYNITIEQYNEISINQDHKCVICKLNNSDNKKSKNLFVDHCHKTGKVRGLLCHRCNVGLGNFKDNMEVLKNAIEYLEKSNNSDELVQLELFPLECDGINK